MGGASAPPFFRYFPFKIGDLGAHPEKICLPLILICLPLILIRGRQSKIMRRVGKIGRRKVFPKVKNVNVESLKNGSKLLDFMVARGSDGARHLLLPSPVLRSLLSLRSSQTLRTIRTIRSIRTFRVLNSIREIRVQKQNVGFVFRFVFSFANTRCVGF